MIPLVVALSLSVAVGGSAAHDGEAVGDGDISLQSAGSTRHAAHAELSGLLGAEFAEICRVMGEPDDFGYSDMYGPHHYLQFGQESGGTVRFCKPHTEVNGGVAAIVAGKGTPLMGVEVGMTFRQISKVLGEPDGGPGPGMDGHHHMEYHMVRDDGEDIYLNFSAPQREAPTAEAFMALQAVSGRQR